MKQHLLTASILLLLAAAAAAATYSFDRYRIIIDRKPFGRAPPPETQQRPVSPAESFARNLRLSAILEVEGGGIRVGLVDKKTHKNFFLSEGESQEGIELVSASFDDEEAVLRKGSEMAVIKLQSGEIKPLGPAEQQARLSRRRPSYAERRRAREARRRNPPPKPKYTGKELERHLQEYQMEVIRQGLPPLPIPLTPEMDAELVAEGVLPPLDEE